MMRKLYFLIAFLAFISSATAHPCNPNDKDYDPSSCNFSERFEKPDDQLPIDWDSIPGIPEVPDIPFPRPFGDDVFGNPFIGGNL